MDDRRRFLIGLAAATFILASGCASFRRPSELEAAAEELESVLRELQPGNQTEILALAEKIKEQSLELQRAHVEFAESFNEAAAQRTTSDAILEALVADYEARRKQSRTALLEAQDDLHAAVPEAAWPEVLAVLNRKVNAIAPQTGSRS